MILFKCLVKSDMHLERFYWILTSNSSSGTRLLLFVSLLFSAHVLRTLSARHEVFQPNHSKELPSHRIRVAVIYRCGVCPYIKLNFFNFENLARYVQLLKRGSEKKKRSTFAKASSMPLVLYCFIFKRRYALHNVYHYFFVFFSLNTE